MPTPEPPRAEAEATAAATAAIGANTGEPQSASEPGGGLVEESHTYETAAARVEEIIRRLDSGEASLNETLELVGEGKALIELCARELQAVSGALEELRLDELVARLESQVSES
jgi:exodeoxyribonuclease VII small subunit